MTDLQKFQAFFIQMDVQCSQDTCRFNGGIPSPNAERAIHSLSVSQAHFIFDKDGVYLGVMADECGCWEVRSK